MLASAFGYWPQVRVRERGDFFSIRRRRKHYSQRKHRIKVHAELVRISGAQRVEVHGIQMIAAYIRRPDPVRVISIRICLLHYYINRERLNHHQTWTEKSSCAWRPFWSDRLEIINVFLQIIIGIIFSIGLSFDQKYFVEWNGCLFDFLYTHC